MLTITTPRLFLTDDDLTPILAQLYAAIDAKQEPTLDFQQCDTALGSLLYRMIAEMIARYGKDEGAFHFRVLASGDRVATIRKALAYYREVRE